MAIKNINEIQSSNYSKHSEQYYQEVLSALANSGQRYGTPGTGFAEISLSLQDILVKDLFEDTSYVNIMVGLWRGELNRYLALNNEDYATETLPIINSENLGGGFGSFFQVNNHYIYSFKDYFYSSDESKCSFILDESDTDNPCRYTSLGLIESNSLEALADQGDASRLDEIALLYKNEKKARGIRTEYIKIPSSQRLFDTKSNTVNANYIFKRKYTVGLDVDNGKYTDICFYKLTNVDQRTDHYLYSYKKYYIDISNVDLNQKTEAIQNLQLLIESIVESYTHDDQGHWITRCCDLDNIWRKVISGDLSLAPVETDFQMNWSKYTNQFVYSNHKQDPLLVYNNKIIQKSLEANLPYPQQSTRPLRFFKRILASAIYNYYSKLSDEQLLELSGPYNPYDKTSNYLVVNLRFNVDTKFNLLVKTGEDGNVLDDTFYYTTTDGILVNECITDDFSKCTDKFLIGEQDSTTQDRCQIILDASRIFNKDVGEKIISSVYNFTFDYLDSSDNTLITSADVTSSRIYTMPYLNDNGYWVINNQITGVLGTCKHSDEPSIIIIHVYKDKFANTNEVLSTNAVNVIDSDTDEATQSLFENISGEILSTYRLNDLKQVNFKLDSIITNNLLSSQNILTKYNVPCLLPDVQQTIDDVNLNYITDYLKSALFVCITDIDCISEAEKFKDNLGNSSVTTFWVYDEDKENSAYFKPILRQADGTVLDLFNLSGTGDVIKYSTENISTTPDRELFTQLVFDDIAVSLKQTPSVTSHYPFISNVTSYTFTQLDPDETTNIGVIPITANYENNANLVISFSDNVEFDNGKVVEGSINSINNKGIQLIYDENTNSYSSLSVKYDNSYDTILNTTADTFIDTLDLSGVLVNHNNIYNRTNFIIPAFSETGYSQIYSSYIGTSAEDSDKSYLIIGTTTKRYNIGPSLLQNSYQDPFKTQTGLKVQMPNFTVNSSENITLDSPEIDLNGTVKINGKAIHGGSQTWIWSGFGTSYSAIFYPVFEKDTYEDYITTFSRQTTKAFINDTVNSYYLQVHEYLKNIFVYESEYELEIQVNIKTSGQYVMTNPVALTVDYDQGNNKILKILEGRALQFGTNFIQN